MALGKLAIHSVACPAAGVGLEHTPGVWGEPYTGNSAIRLKKKKKLQSW